MNPIPGEKRKPKFQSQTQAKGAQSHLRLHVHLLLLHLSFFSLYRLSLSLSPSPSLFLSLYLSLSLSLSVKRVGQQPLPLLYRSRVLTREMTAASVDVTKLPKRENISSMDGSLPVDETFNCNNITYDDIKNLDFSMEDIEENFECENWCEQFQHLEPPASLDYLLCPTVFNENDYMKQMNLSTSYEQTSQITQLPSVAAKTIRGRAILRSDDLKSVADKSIHDRSSLHSDDLESIGSSAARFEPKFEKRTRSKLSRSKRTSPPIFNAQFITSTSSNSSASENLYRWDASESDLEASLTEEMSNSVKGKQKKKRNCSQFSGGEMRKLSSEEPGESRDTKRCSHCAVAKTPQWREGPLGPKTLCNACGVRYRSGRLFPEYRPAASPTFVPSVHSNSHKKVIELRNKGCQGATMGILSSGR